MKVALLNVVCYGSTGKIARGIAGLVRAQGGEAGIFYGRGDACGDPDAVRVDSALEIGLHVLMTRLFDRTGFFSERATRRLVEKLRAYDPDVIHLHNLHGYWLDLRTLFSYLQTCGKPVVWTLHDCWAMTGHCMYNIASGCTRYRTGCHACPERKTYPQRWLFDASKRNFADKKRLFTAVPNMTTVTPSNWLAGMVRTSFLQGYPVRVMPNGIDLTVFRPMESDLRARYGLTDKRILLGVAQVWDRRKGLDSFVALQKRMDAQTAVVLIGLTDKQIKALPAGILGLPRTGNAAELAAWYSAADVFVDCTHEENFPTTHLEALACGTPVVTYIAGGSAEMLTKDCGTGVPADDLDGLIAAVDAAASLDRAACVRQAALYGEQTRLNAYLSLYEEIMG